MGKDAAIKKSPETGPHLKEAGKQNKGYFGHDSDALDGMLDGGTVQGEKVNNSNQNYIGKTPKELDALLHKAPKENSGPPPYHPKDHPDKSQVPDLRLNGVLKNQMLAEVKQDKSLISDKNQGINEKGQIYYLYNNKSGKIYVGQTIQTLRERLQGHFSSAYQKTQDKSDFLQQTHLYRAIRKYKKKSFSIHQCHKIRNKPQWVLNGLETKYIDYYHSLKSEIGYNMERSGKGGKQSPESNKARSETLMNHPVNQETRKKISRKLKGRISPTKGIKQNPEWIEKRAAASRDKPKSEVTKQLISQSLSGSNHPLWGTNLPEQWRKNISIGRKRANIRPTPEQIEKGRETKRINAYKNYFPEIKEIRDPTLLNAKIQEKNNKLEKLIKQGHSIKQIANKLKIHTDAVRTLFLWNYRTRSIREIGKILSNRK